MNPADETAPPAWSPASSLRIEISESPDAPSGSHSRARWSGLESRESATPIDEVIHELNGVVHGIRLLAHSAERNAEDPLFQAEVPDLMRKSIEQVQRCVDRLQDLRQRAQ